MKISDVCRQYGFDENDLKAFLKEKKLLKETWTSYVIEDSNVDKAVRMYAEFKAQQEEEAISWMHCRRELLTLVSMARSS